MKKLIFLLVLIVIGIANAKAQSTPSSMPVQKNTDVKVAKTNVQIPATIAGQNLSSDQPTLAPAQKMAKKDAIKLPLIQKEQIKL
jgi:hypothetical protein